MSNQEYCINEKENMEIPNETKAVSGQEIKDESIIFDYLQNNNFSRTLPKLVQKLKGKKVLLYGAGALLEVAKKYYDLSGMNIIGITDQKYSQESGDNKFLGYKIYSMDKIKELNPDYIIVSVKNNMRIIVDFDQNVLSGTKIKIRPLVKRSFKTVLKEALEI